MLFQLVNNTLDFSYLEAGKIDLIIKRFNIVPFLRETIRIIIQSKSPAVDILFSPVINQYFIETDMIRLQQIVLNVLWNAVKFTKEGHIKLSFEIDEKNDKIIFEVEDTGCGIPKEKSETIFARAEQRESSTQEIGLGLPVSKMLIEKLRGKIWVDKDYKEGAKFMFYIPIKYKE